MKKKILLMIIVNIAVVCTLIVFIEIAGQAAYYIKHGKFVFQADDYGYGEIFELHPFHAVRLKKNVRAESNGKTITTTSRHTRWTGAPEDDRGRIRLAVLGGSTAFGTNVTDSESWPALLQSKLGDQFSVINYGAPNFLSAEAIIQMAFIVPEAKPEFVIVYQGWNDIFQYHIKEFSPDYYDHGMDMYGKLSVPVNRDKTLFEKLNDLSAIARAASKIKNMLPKKPAEEPCETFDTPDPYVDRIYTRNLNTLKLLSEQTASYTLFVPQVLNYHKFIENKDNESCNWQASGHIKHRAFPVLMDRFNSFMREVCANGDPECIFVEAVLKVNWEPDDFVDWGHFSKKGGEKFADVLSREITSKIKEVKSQSDHRLVD